MDVLFLIAGIALLFVGGEMLVRNASKLARAWGISPMVIGLTIVAFGTSSPELAASLAASLRGVPEIAVGNVIGSNIANVALILAITAVIHPLRAQARFLKRDTPIMIGIALILVLLFLDGELGRLEGLGFVIGLATYLAILFRAEEPPEVESEFIEEFGARPARTWAAGVGAAAGLVLLVAGAHLLVEGATSIARGLGVPELVIGLTLVAVGTSLPELATSVIAALKREPDIALGNVVGSNVFNILGILGITVLVRPVAVPFGAIMIDLAVMVAASVILWPFLRTGMRLGRREGAFLLLAYGAYLAYLALRA